MNIDDKCPLFVRTEEEIAEIRKSFGLNETSIVEGVDSIIDWFNKQPHLVQAGLSRTNAEKMIIISKGSIERAKEKINAFYKYRGLMPEFIQNRQEILHSPAKIWDMFYIAPVPRLQENRAITVIKYKEDLDKFDLTDFFRKLCLHLDLRLKYDYTLGEIWILDAEPVSWAKLFTQNPLIFKKMAELFMKGLNCRIYGIHVINLSASTSIIQRVIDFFNQFVTSTIMSRLMIHDNVENLYKYVPKECLPEDYGGNAPSVLKIAELVENEYRKPETVEYFLQSSKMVSDESMRPRDEESEEFLAGTFRKLEVD